MHLRAALLVVFALLIIGAATSFVLLRSGALPAPVINLIDQVYGPSPAANPRPIHFVVQPGEDAATIGDRLQSAGLVRSGLAFRVIVRDRGLAPHLVAGDYELRANMSLDEIISALAQGRMSGGLVTIPEGWRALQVADALSRDGVVDRAEFLRVVSTRRVSLPAPLQTLPAGASLEGYLFPDSYRFARGVSAEAVAQQMVDDFSRRLTPALEAGFASNGLSIAQAVTLASIVEREAVTPAERPIIASVYLNRLRRGMKLQADPTVQFALVDPNAPGGEPRATYWKSSLTFADLRVVSPYNTYEVSGLPPGPICDPGVASLEAVARPATTDYLYFVARPDNTHAFATTFAEQQRNVSRYQH